MTSSDRIEELFKYWREKGYPHYDRNEYDAFDELDKIIQYDTRELIDGDNIVQTMHGLGFLWTFHPHWVEVNNILELWNDDDKLRELGWKPKKVFHEELPKIVEYYKNNFKW